MYGIMKDYKIHYSKIFLFIVCLLQQQGASDSACTNPPCLIFANTSSASHNGDLANINILKLDTEAIETIDVGQLNDVTGIDLDISAGKMYWTDLSDKIISRANIDGTGKQVITQFSVASYDIAVDWIGKNLYYTDDRLKVVTVSQLDGSRRKVLFSNNVLKPRGIAVDPADRFMFWADTGKIERASMDGTNRQVIVTGRSSVSGVDVDPATKKLYWVDNTLDKLETSDYSGNGKTVLFQQNNLHPFDVTAFQSYAYWSELKAVDQIVRYDLNTGSLYQYKGVVRDVWGMTVYHSSRQPSGTNQCSSNNGGCEYLCLLTTQGSTCTCPSGVVLKSDGKTCNSGIDKFFLVNDGDTATIQQISLDNSDYVRDVIPILSSEISRPIAVDYDPIEKKLYWSDVVNHTIQRANIDGSSFEPVHLSDVAVPDGLAVDHVNRLLYWTDSAQGSRHLTDRIAVSYLNGSYMRVLISKDLDQPRALVLHLSRRQMFWSDWGTFPRIERSSMDGSNRKVLVNTNLGWPNGLALDITNSYLYWVDAKLDNIKRIDLDGSTSPYTVLTLSNVHPFGSTIYNGELYWTDWQTRDVRKLNLGSLTQSVVTTGFQQPMDIHVYDSQHQQTGTKACGQNNGGCSHLCLPNPGSYQCSCPTGYRLESDGKTCMNDLTEFLMFTDIDEREFYRILMNTDTYAHKLLFHITNPTDTKPVAMAYDHEHHRNYWVDSGVSGIVSILDNLTSAEYFLRCNIDSPEGIAFDWLARNLYWTDANPKRIEVANVDSHYRKVLITTGLDKPRDIEVDPKDGYMYWTDWGSSPKIEKARMDGTSQVTLVNSNLIWPNGLAIDSDNNKLYWVDAGLSFIKRVNLDGTSVETVLQSIYQGFGLAYYQDKLFWTEWYTKSVHVYDLTTKENATIIASGFSKPGSIHAYDLKLRQNVTNPCGTNNGGCSHLCLIVPQSYKCACPTAMTMNSDGKTCDTEKYKQEFDQLFLLVADASMGTIERISLSHTNRPCYELPMTAHIERPVGMDYDPQEDRVYWTDVKLQHNARSFLNGSSDEVIALSTHADGAAVDWVSRNFYWTDTGNNTIHVSRLDGSYSRVILSWGNDEPRDIALDPVSGYMYWTDWGSSPRINKARMDGNSKSTIISGNLHYPNGLALDRKNQYVYWVDGHYDKIERADMTGNNRQLIIDITESVHLFGLELHNGYLYWTGWDSKDIHRTQIGSCSSQYSLSSCNDTVISTGLRKPMDLRVYGAGIHTGDVNLCSNSNGGCSHLCLPIPSGRVCQCPEGVSIKSTDPTACEGVTTCPALSAPLHGTISTCGKHEGNTCDMSCNLGYVLSGTASRHCQNDGTWSGTDTTCTVVSCTALSTPVNVDLLTPNCGHVYGSQCTFQCQTGYNQTSGNTVRTCQTDGTWDGSNLNCFIVKCPSLSKPSNGLVSPTNCTDGQIDYNTYCTFSCASGYQLNGPTSKHCLNTGQWTDQDLQVTCLDIENPVFITCPSNQSVYAPSGQQTASISWTLPQATDNSGVAPTITSNTNNPPHVFNEGQHHVIYTATDTAGNKAFCSFSVEVTVLRCSALASPSNGFLNNCGTNYGSTCQFSCQTGYILTGSAQRTCQATNNRPPAYWDGSTTNCAAITCVALNKPTNGQSTCSSNSTVSYGTVCHLSCDIGYSSSGSNTRTCQLNSTWSGTDFKCTAIQCSGLSAPVHGDITPSSCSSNSQYGQQCTFSCDTGYQLIGSYTKTCGANGMWSGGDATCKDNTKPVISNCPASKTVTLGSCASTIQVTWTEPTASDNSGSLELNSNMQPPVNLNQGFYIVEYHAQDSSGNNATCSFHFDVKRITCPTLNAPSKGSVISQSCQVWFGSKTILQCDSGYNLYGSAQRTCQSNGQWSGTQTSCSVITCNPLATLLHGSIVPSTCLGPNALPYNTTCTFMCDTTKGFLLTGPQNTMCLISGSWQHTTSSVECKDMERPTITCPDPVIAGADLGQDSTLVSWSSPTVQDNSQQPGQLTITSDHPEYSSPRTFQIGTYSIIYTVTDTAGHHSSCTLKITVEDHEPPVIECPDNVDLMSTEATPEIEIKAPSITENNLIAHIELYMDGIKEWFSTNLDEFPIKQNILRGEHNMTFIVTDKSGNSANCTFEISIASIECAKLDAPRHGSMACHKGKILHFCTPHCDDDYQFAAQPSQTYFCSDSGKWHGYTASAAGTIVPDCSKEEPLEEIKLDTELHYAGNCSDQDALENIKQNFITLVKETRFYKSCQLHATEGCEIAFDEITVDCDATSRRRRSSKATSLNQNIILHFQIHVAVDMNKTHDANSTAFHYAESLKQSLNETFYLQAEDNKQVPVIKDVHYTFGCKKGQILIGSICLSCPLGHHFINESCLPCPKDHYQDEEAQTKCKICPEGTSTKGDIAAKVKSMCTAPLTGETTSRQGSSALVIAMSIIGVILVAIIVIVFIKWKNSKHNRTDIPFKGGCTGLQRTESNKSFAFDVTESRC